LRDVKLILSIFILSGVLFPGISSINTKIEKYSELYKVSPELIKAIVQVESNYNPKARSRKGAIGLMQLMKKTAAQYGVVDRYNIDQNLKGGIKYIRDLKKQHPGSLSLVLAVYNAGPVAVKKYNGVPPYKETKNYIKKIFSLLGKKHLEADTLTRVLMEATSINKNSIICSAETIGE